MDKSAPQIFQSAYNDALQRNTENIAYNEKRKQDLENLNLRNYSDCLSVPVLVPVGSKVLIRGSLIHTNEVLVALSDQYFAKCSVKQAEDLKQHRIQKIEKQLCDLEAEKEYLTNQTSFMKDSVFDIRNGGEIIEPYDEEAETKWRAIHIENVRNSKQNKEVTTSISDEDVMARLDELEIQEDMDVMASNEAKLEIEDAKTKRNSILNKLKEVRLKCAETCQADVIKRLDLLEEEEMLQDELDRLSDSSSSKDSQESDEETTQITKQSNKKRISFDCSDQDTNTLSIHFSHSDNMEVKIEESDKIVSPSDIYHHFPECFNSETKPLKSILKNNSNYNNSKNINNDIENSHMDINEDKDARRQVVIGDIIESDGAHLDKSTNRPMSKFRAQRLKKAKSS